MKIIILLIFFLYGCESIFYDEFTIKYPKIEPKKTDFYKVKKGDNLYSISKKFNISIKKIIKHNGIKEPFKIYPNQRIFLPKNVYYRVKKGDTLYSISRKLKSNVYSISKLNKLKDINQIKVGQRILIPEYFEQKKNNPTLKKKTIQKKKKVVQVKSISKSSNTQKFIWPVKGKILIKYGSGDSGFFNDGINIKSSSGIAVKASNDGEIIYSGNEIPGYGNLILIKHNKNLITAYAHLEKIEKTKGDLVKRGQSIGIVGNTGNVKDVQLHFEIRKGKNAVNPLKHLS